MSRSGKVSITFEFLRCFGAAEKNKAEFSGSQSVENVLFCQENKNSNFDSFFLELDMNPPTSF